MRLLASLRQGGVCLAVVYGTYHSALTDDKKFGHIPMAPRRTALKFKESCAMSDHQLKFKGPGFDFDAKGWLGIGAAILIVLLVPRLLY